MEMAQFDATDMHTEFASVKHLSSNMVEVVDLTGARWVARRSLYLGEPPELWKNGEPVVPNFDDWKACLTTSKWLLMHIAAAE